MTQEQMTLNLGGWPRDQARATPLAEAKQESCGSCRFFEPELKPLSRKPEGYCLRDYNRPRLTSDEPCSRWRPHTDETSLSAGRPQHER